MLPAMLIVVVGLAIYIFAAFMAAATAIYVVAAVFKVAVVAVTSMAFAECRAKTQQANENQSLH